MGELIKTGKPKKDRSTSGVQGGILVKNETGEGYALPRKTYVAKPTNTTPAAKKPQGKEPAKSVRELRKRTDTFYNAQPAEHKDMDELRKQAATVAHAQTMIGRSEAMKKKYGVEQDQDALSMLEQLAAAKTALDSQIDVASHQNDNFLQRLGNTGLGGLKQSAGSNIENIGNLGALLSTANRAAGGFDTRIAQEGENRQSYRKQLADVQKQIDDITRAAAAKERVTGEKLDLSQHPFLPQLQDRAANLETLIDRTYRRQKGEENLASMETADLDKAVQAAYDYAGKVSQSGAMDVERAKSGLGTVGQVLVDAGSSTLQSGIDGIIGAATGSGMIPFATRAFGGSTQQMRMENPDAELGRRFLYGAAQAAKEVATEKMFGVTAFGKMVAGGGGSIDDMVEGAILKAVDKFAKSEAGRNMLGGVLTLGAGALGEGLEEAIGDLLEYPIERLIAGKSREEASEALSGIVYDFITGAVSGAMGGGLSANVWNYNAVNPMQQGTLDALNALAQERENMVQQGNLAPAVQNRVTGQETASIGIAPVAETLGENGRKAMRKAFENGAQSVEAVREFTQVYNAASEGREAPATRSLSETQRFMAQASGENDLKTVAPKTENSYTENKKFDVKPGLVRDEKLKAANVKRSTERALDALGQVLGVEVRFADTVNEGRSNASYANGVMTLALDADDPVLTSAVHEAVHRVREASPESYERLHSFVVGHMSELNMQDALQSRERAYQTSDVDYLSEEVVADAFGRMMGNEKVLRDLVTDDRTTAQKLLDAVHDIIVSIQNALSKDKKTLSQSQISAFSDLAGSLSEAETLLRDALGSVEGQQSNGETKYSAKAERGRSIETETMENNRFDRLRQYYGDELPSEWYAYTKDYFYVYSNQSYTEYTLLAKCRITSGNRAAINQFMEELQNGTYGSAETFDQWTAHFRRGKGRDSWHSVSPRQSGKTGRNDGVDVRARGSDDGANSQTGSGDREVKPKFSMKEPVEETKDLIALHNLTEQNLLDAANLGGLPSPSIAIVKAKEGHSKYGPISLIFNKKTIDPQADKRNKVYGSDAWTPTMSNAQVDYEIKYDKMIAMERNLAQLAKKTAGGVFSSGSLLRSLGIEESTNSSPREVAERLAAKDEVKAAYLAAKGEAIEPTMKAKQYNRWWGNDVLQGFTDKIGEQRLAATVVNLETNDSLNDALADVKDDILKTTAEAYEAEHRSYLDRIEARVPGRKQAAIDQFVEEKATVFYMEDFVRDAWKLYEEGGQPSDEIDRLATSNVLAEKASTKDVSEWLLPQLEEIYGKKGIYNGKEPYTSHGNKRSYKDLHWDYTLENIVRAMNQASARGANMWGVGGGGLVATATPSYDSIGEIKADSSRLQNLSQDDYDEIVHKISDQLDDVIGSIMRTTKHHSDNTFEETDIIGTIIMEAGQKKNVSAVSVRNEFRKEGYSITEQQAQRIIKCYEAAAQVPTGYFEAKPQRAVGFDEVTAAVVPSDINEKARKALTDNGVNVLTYEAGNDADRIAKVNSVENAKFSLKSKTFENLREENAALREKLDELKGAVQTAQRKGAQAEYWKGQTKRTTATTLRQGDVDKFSNNLLKGYSSTLKTSDINERVKALGEYMLRGTDGKNELTYGEVKDRAVDIARDIVESAEVLVDNENEDLYREVKSLLKRKISITNTTARDIPDFNEWRKRYFNTLGVGVQNGGTQIGVVYSELSDMAPWLFPNDITNPTDMLLQMADSLDSMRAVYENPHSAYMADAIEYCANDIIDGLMDETVRQNPQTFADRQAFKLQEQKAKDARKLEKLREQKNERIAEIRKQGRENAKQAVAAAKAQRDEQIAKMKQHYADVAEAKRERKADSAARTRLLHIVKRLKNKKLPAVNRALLNEYIGDLDTVSKSMTGKTVQKLTDLQAWYANEKETNPDFIADPAIEKMLARLSQRHISDLTNEEVADLTTVLLNIENEIRTQRKTIDTEDRRDTYFQGLDVIRDVEQTKGSKTGVAGIPGKYIVTETLSPVRQLHRMTGYNDADPLYLRTQELADGQRKMLDYQMKASKPFNKYASDKAFNKMFSGKDAETIKVAGLSKNGPTEVEITPAMRVSLYLHSLNDQNLKHIAGGGITVPDAALYRKGELAEAYARGTTIKLTPSQVRAITSRMTTQERAFANEVSRYFNVTSKQSINEVSEKLKGYSLAEVENYFPINTDSRFTKSEFESIKMDGTIEGMGFLKERINASNPILLRDVNAVLEQAIDMHSKYVGMAIPVRNFNKLWNVAQTIVDEDGEIHKNSDSLQAVMSRKWGKDGMDYIENMMKDMQGDSRTRNKWGAALAKVRSKYAGAVLTLNLSVAAKQAASYPTAAAVLGWKPLTRAMRDIGKVDLDLIAKYTPLQWYRSQGFSTKELGDLKKSDSILNNLPPALNWVQGMDVVTTRKLWKASEYYVREHSPSLVVGTDAYYKEVARMYNRVIEETQPNYTTMQRPQLLRTDDSLLANLAMFKTQPFQNFNILYDAFANYEAKRRQNMAGGTADTKAALESAKRDLGNAVTSQIAQMAVFAGMTMAWAMFRGRDDDWRDEDGNLDPVKLLGAFAKNMAGGAFSIVPFGSDAWEYVSSKLFNEKYYGMDAVTVEAITNTLTSFSKMMETVGGVISSAAEGKDIEWQRELIALDDEIDDISKVLGVPYENVFNLFAATYRWAAIGTQGEYMGRYSAMKFTQVMRKKSSSAKRGYTINSAYYDLLYDAKMHDTKAYNAIYKQMLADGIEASDLDKAMKARGKK